MARALLLFALSALLLSACAPQTGSVQIATEISRPPEATSAAPAGGNVSPNFPEPSPAPSCSNDLRWEQDLTVPDGMNVDPGETLDKRWLVTNIGTCNWDASYSLRLVGGPAMGAPEQQALYPARAGTQASIRIVFTAPDARGNTISAWQAYAPDGEPFGDPIYIQVYVR